MNPLALFTGPYGFLAKWGVIALLAAAVGAYSWVKGNQHGTEKLTEYQAAQALESVKIITRQGEVTERVVKEYIKVKGKTEVVTKTVKQEVIKYVESKPLTLACYLDRRWVRLHDAAAVGVVPPPRQLDDGETGAPTAPGLKPPG